MPQPYDTDYHVKKQHTLFIPAALLPELEKIVPIHGTYARIHWASGNPQSKDDPLSDPRNKGLTITFSTDHQSVYGHHDAESMKDLGEKIVAYAEDDTNWF